MKKVIFTLIIGLFTLGLAFSQDVVDFEDPSAYILGGAMDQVVVANPDASGINTSDSVLSLTRSENSLWSEQAYVNVEPNFTLTDGNTRLNFDVYSTGVVENTRLYVRFRTGTGILEEGWAGPIATANEWVTIYYDGAPTGVEIDSIQFEVGSWSGGTEDSLITGTTVYIDNITAVAPPAVYVDPRIVIDIQKATGDVTIDGAPLEQDWVDAETNVVANGDSLTGYGCSFKALWDETNLYLFFDVTDGTPFEYDGADGWQKDGIQIYCDVRNLLLDGRKEDSRQHSMVFNYNAELSDLSGWDGSVIDTIYADETQEHHIEFESLASSAGYYLEAKIPLGLMYFDGNDETADTYDEAMASVDLAVNDIIGFEVQANDYDEGAGDRVAVMTWSSTSGDDPGAYENSGVWGGFKLVDGEVAVQDLISSDISVYPNPVQNELIIEGDNISSVELISVLGKVVLSVDYTDVINVAGLESGVYILKVTTDNNEVFSTRILKN